MLNTTNFQINTTTAFRKILGRNIILLMIVYKCFIRLSWNKVPKQLKNENLYDVTKSCD